MFCHQIDYFLFFTVLPTFTEIPRDAIAIERTSVTFKCSASGLPEPDIKWIIDDSSSKLPLHSVDNNVLTIFNVTNDNTYERSYTCEATNRGGKINKTVKLAVDGKHFKIVYETLNSIILDMVYF